MTFCAARCGGRGGRVRGMDGAPGPREFADSPEFIRIDRSWFKGRGASSVHIRLCLRASQHRSSRFHRCRGTASVRRVLLAAMFDSWHCHNIVTLPVYSLRTAFFSETSMTDALRSQPHRWALVLAAGEGSRL